MNRDPIVLFDNGTHKCLQFDQLVQGEGIQSNQFLIIDSDQEMLLDPGGNLTYTPLSLELAKHIDIKELTYVFASHQDPDIIAALDKWLLYTNAKVLCSRLWQRFLPHIMANYTVNVKNINLAERIVGLPDKGQVIPLGVNQVTILPAHFMHSVGNFQVYDPVSKILFSGDLGSSIVDNAQPVQSFSDHISKMEGFHRRYMCSNKVLRLWANMARQMDIEMIVPQHGSPFVGKEMVSQFLSWVENLYCGIDLLSEENYQVPFG